MAWQTHTHRPVHSPITDVPNPNRLWSHLGSGHRLQASHIGMRPKEADLGCRPDARNGLHQSGQIR